MAQPIPFPESNKKLAPPRGVSDDACEYLHIFTNGEQCISCWQLSPEEQAEFQRNGGRLYLHVWSGPTQPPVCVSPKYPFVNEIN